MVSVRQPGKGPQERRSIWTSAMFPKMVVSGRQAGEAGVGEGAARNKTAEGISALEAARNNTRGGSSLSIGGLTLGGQGGGITVNGNGNQGQQQGGQPAAAKPAEGAIAAPAGGQPAGVPAEGAPAAGEAVKKPEEITAVRESEQFDGSAGITADRAGNAVNLGGDLGITKGSDGSTSVGGEAGINIIARAIGAVPASPAPAKALTAPAIPSIPAAPAALNTQSLPSAAPASPAPLAALGIPTAPKALPSTPAPAAAQNIPALPAAIPASPGQATAPAVPVLAPAASATSIPNFIPGTIPSR